MKLNIAPMRMYDLNIEVVNDILKVEDVKKKELHYKDPKGRTWMNRYDSAGNVIYTQGSDGEESWYEYNEHGNETHYVNSHGFETWKDYNAKGLAIHYRDSDGIEQWVNDEGNIIAEEEYNKLHNPPMVETITVKGIKYNLFPNPDTEDNSIKYILIPA